MRDWLAIGCFWLGGFAFGWLASDVAHAAPLKVHSKPANLYGGRLFITTVRGDVRGPGTATVYVNGLGKYGDDGDWPHEWKIKLHKGKNHFAKTFFVRHWDRTPYNNWVATKVWSVYADLKVERK